MVVMPLLLAVVVQHPLRAAAAVTSRDRVPHDAQHLAGAIRSQGQPGVRGCSSVHPCGGTDAALALNATEWLAG
jgi:hypothetical protein